MKAIVYILLCSDGRFYVGHTTNLELRLKEHNGEHHIYDKGSDFTISHRPFKLVYTEEYETVSEATRRERQLHKWSHSKKEALIDGDIERLKLLSKSKNVRTGLS